MIFDEHLYRNLNTPTQSEVVRGIRVIELEVLLRAIQKHEMARLAVLPEDPTCTVAETIARILNYQSDFWEEV